MPPSVSIHAQLQEAGVCTSSGGAPEQPRTWKALKAAGTPASERWGHSVCLWGGKKLVIFGGYTSAESESSGSVGGKCFNDVHILDIETLQWQRPIVGGNAPESRWGHSAVIVKDKILIFGGYSSTRVEGNTFFSDFHVLDLTEMTWSQPVIHGVAPSERWGNSATLVGNKVIVFGGYSRSSSGIGRCFNDLFVFDIATMSWEAPGVTGEPPSERTGHSATLVGNRLYLIGGASAGDHCFNDVHIFDIEKRHWWKPGRIYGKRPTERCGHLAALAGSEIVVYGGVGAGDTGFRCLNDVHVFDLERTEWRQPGTSGAAPSERWGHSAVMRGSSLYVVGGYANGGARRGPYCHDMFAIELELSAVPSLTELCVRAVRARLPTLPNRHDFHCLPPELRSRIDLPCVDV
eukprot:tig00000144_g9014.t1